MSDAITRAKLLDALSSGIAENDGMVLACFDPRHGIRVIANGHEHDYVICFHCFTARWYIDGVQNHGFVTTGSPQSEFDGVLRDASIELSADARE
ncbi:MAG: hypothetical protein AAGJ40_20200 [Planctomycetota bacterium]